MLTRPSEVSLTTAISGDRKGRSGEVKYVAQGQVLCESTAAQVVPATQEACGLHSVSKGSPEAEFPLDLRRGGHGGSGPWARGWEQDGESRGTHLQQAPRESERQGSRILHPKARALPAA